jgi:hypothetical protein
MSTPCDLLRTLESALLTRPGNHRAASNATRIVFSHCPGRPDALFDTTTGNWNCLTCGANGTAPELAALLELAAPPPRGIHPPPVASQSLSTPPAAAGVGGEPTTPGAGEPCTVRDAQGQDTRPGPTSTPAPGERTCPGCGRSFKPRRPSAKACSLTCRMRAFRKRHGKAALVTDVR